MSSATPFPELIRRLRAGDEAAVREFVSAYEPFIRRTLRRRLARTPLQAIADSADVCQSILCSFLIRAAAGEYVLTTPDNLVKLLMGMARKKLAALTRRETAECRDRRRTQSLEDSGVLPANAAKEPCRVVMGRDLLDEVARRLPENERSLFELRQQGHSWDSIVVRVGGNAGVMRKQLSRALHRVAAELGLEDGDV